MKSLEKLNELLEFPCNFTFKVVGEAKPELADEVLTVVQKNLPGDYVPKIKKSKNGNFYSVSITCYVQNISQVETLYKELSEIEIVKMVL